MVLKTKSIISSKSLNQVMCHAQSILKELEISQTITGLTPKIEGDAGAAKRRRNESWTRNS